MSLPRILLAAFILAAAVTAHAAPAADAAVVEARRLIDSWSGQREVLAEAQRALDRALQLDPAHREALKQLARLQIKAGYRRERSVQYRQNTYTIGEFEPGTLERAEATLRKAIALHPEFGDAYVLLAHVQTQQTKLHEAIESLDRAEALGTGDPWLHLNRAEVHAAMGEHASAAERWQKVLRGEASDPHAMHEARNRLLQEYIRTRRHDEAVTLYRQQIESDPGDAWQRGNFASYLTGTLGRHDEAIAQARSALAIMDYGAGRRILAMALYGRWAELVDGGKDAEGERHFAEAQALYPNLDLVMVNGASKPSGERLAKALNRKKGVAIDARDRDGSTALLIAVNTNKPQPVAFLLALKADPNATDRNGWTPLLSAADEGNEEIARMLLAAGADTRATLNGRDAATIAERRGLALLARDIRAKLARQP